MRATVDEGNDTRLLKRLLDEGLKVPRSWWMMVEHEPSCPKLVSPFDQLCRCSPEITFFKRGFG